MDPGLIALVIGVFVVFVLIKAISGKRSSEVHGYRMRKAFMSPAERSFYGVLCAAVANDYVVLAKVRVADVITPNRNSNRSKWQTAFNQISSKHFDYVLCDPNTLAVERVVELHDKSHKSTKRARRDEFLRAACESAGLPFREFAAKARYSVNEVTIALSDQEEAGQ